MNSEVPVIFRVWRDDLARLGEFPLEVTYSALIFKRKPHAKHDMLLVDFWRMWFGAVVLIPKQWLSTHPAVFTF